MLATYEYEEVCTYSLVSLDDKSLQRPRTETEKGQPHNSTNPARPPFIIMDTSKRGGLAPSTLHPNMVRQRLPSWSPFFLKRAYAHGHVGTPTCLRLVARAQAASSLFHRCPTRTCFWRVAKPTGNGQLGLGIAHPPSPSLRGANDRPYHLMQRTDGQVHGPGAGHQNAPQLVRDRARVSTGPPVVLRDRLPRR